MGIDLVVASLSTEWSHYASSSLPLLSSLERLVAWGEEPPPYDRGLAERAFVEPSPWEWNRGSKVESAIRRFQASLSARFDRTITWQDPGPTEDYMGQIDVHAALAVRGIIERAGVDRFSNLATLDIANMYLPIELPCVLVGQPRSLGSALALQREIAAAVDLTDADLAVREHLDLLHEACEHAIASSAVVLVSG